MHKLKNKEDKSSSTHSEAQEDKTTFKTEDSATTAKFTEVHKTHTVTGYDTFALVGADSSLITGLVPDTGHTKTFVDGDETIKVGVDTNGVLTIKTYTKPKVIPIRSTTTTDTYDTIGSNTQTKVATASTDHDKTLSKVDSTHHEKTTTKSKVANSLGTWWIWLIIILIILVYIFYKCYTKGINPVMWFR